MTCVHNLAQSNMIYQHMQGLLTSLNSNNIKQHTTITWVTLFLRVEYWMLIIIINVT